MGQCFSQGPENGTAAKLTTAQRVAKSHGFLNLAQPIPPEKGVKSGSGVAVNLPPLQKRRKFERANGDDLTWSGSPSPGLYKTNSNRRSAFTSDGTINEANAVIPPDQTANVAPASVALRRTTSDDLSGSTSSDTYRTCQQSPLVDDPDADVWDGARGGTGDDGRRTGGISSRVRTDRSTPQGRLQAQGLIRDAEAAEECAARGKLRQSMSRQAGAGSDDGYVNPGSNSNQGIGAGGTSMVQDVWTERSSRPSRGRPHQRSADGDRAYGGGVVDRALWQADGTAARRPPEALTVLKERPSSRHRTSTSLRRGSSTSASAAAAAAAALAAAELEVEGGPGGSCSSDGSPRWASRLAPVEMQASLLAPSTEAAAAEPAEAAGSALASGSAGGGDTPPGRDARWKRSASGTRTPGSSSAYQVHPDLASPTGAGQHPADASSGAGPPRAPSAVHRSSLQLLRRATANRVKAAVSAAGISPQASGPVDPDPWTADLAVEPQRQEESLEALLRSGSPRAQLVAEVAGAAGGHGAPTQQQEQQPDKEVSALEDMHLESDTEGQLSGGGRGTVGTEGEEQSSGETSRAGGTASRPEGSRTRASRTLVRLRSEAAAHNAAVPAGPKVRLEYVARQPLGPLGRQQLLSPLAPASRASLLTAEGDLASGMANHFTQLPLCTPLATPDGSRELNKLGTLRAQAPYSQHSPVKKPAVGLFAAEARVPGLRQSKTMLERGLVTQQYPYDSLYPGQASHSGGGPSLSSRVGLLEDVPELPPSPFSGQAQPQPYPGAGGSGIPPGRQLTCTVSLGRQTAMRFHEPQRAPLLGGRPEESRRAPRFDNEASYGSSDGCAPVAAAPLGSGACRRRPGTPGVALLAARQRISTSALGGGSSGLQVYPQQQPGALPCQTDSRRPYVSQPGVADDCDEESPWVSAPIAGLVAGPSAKSLKPWDHGVTAPPERLTPRDPHPPSAILLSGNEGDGEKGALQQRQQQRCHYDEDEEDRKEEGRYRSEAPRPAGTSSMPRPPPQSYPFSHPEDLQTAFTTQFDNGNPGSCYPQTQPYSNGQQQHHQHQDHLQRYLHQQQQLQGGYPRHSQPQARPPPGAYMQLGRSRPSVDGSLAPGRMHPHEYDYQPAQPHKERAILMAPAEEGSAYGPGGVPSLYGPPRTRSHRFSEPVPRAEVVQPMRSRIQPPVLRPPPPGSLSYESDTTYDEDAVRYRGMTGSAAGTPRPFLTAADVSANLDDS